MSLSHIQAAIIKAMLARGDKQHDIAARFGVNGGRIAEIASGAKFQEVPKADNDNLPPAGPVCTEPDQRDLFDAAINGRSLDKKWNELEQRIAKIERQLGDRSGG